MFEYPFLLIDALLFSSFWSLAFTAVFAVVAILTVASEAIAASYIALIVWILALSIFTPLNAFSYVIHNPWVSFQFLIGYFLVGALYSSIKYRSYAKAIVAKIAAIKIRFIKLEKLEIGPTDEIPEPAFPDWKNYFINQDWSLYHKVVDGFNPGNQKTLIIDWIVFWPFSAVGLIVADPLRRFVNFLYETMSDIYQHMYERLITSKINMKDLNLK